MNHIKVNKIQFGSEVNNNDIQCLFSSEKGIIGKHLSEEDNKIPDRIIKTLFGKNTK